jgi:hypothetical protein
MRQQPGPGEAPEARRTPRPPALPRAVVDTRMPPAPAPGGRVITVGRPDGRVRKGGLDGGLVIVPVAIAAILTVGWRLLRRSGVRQGLL